MAYCNLYLAHWSHCLAHCSPHFSHWSPCLVHWNPHLAHWSSHVAHWIPQLPIGALNCPLEPLFGPLEPLGSPLEPLFGPLESLVGPFKLLFGQLEPLVGLLELGVYIWAWCYWKKIFFEMDIHYIKFQPFFSWLIILHKENSYTENTHHYQYTKKISYIGFFLSKMQISGMFWNLLFRIFNFRCWRAF